jgi:hypothetical protein
MVVEPMAGDRLEDNLNPGRPTLISPPGPVTIPRYAPFPVRGSVHLSRQFLEKLTESAIIKVAP